MSATTENITTMTNANEGNPFTLGQVLSITTGRLMCDIGGVYSILSHMTGQSLFTHQLPEAGRLCKPILLQAFPQLAGIELGDVNKDNYLDKCAALTAIHGDSFDCPTLSTWKYSDPIQSAIDMMGEDRVMTVRA